MKNLPYLFLVLWLLACTDQVPVMEEVKNFAITFKPVSKEHSGISFVNRVNEFDTKINYFTYFQIYSGSGVAVGDLNNDGLTDIFFQSAFEGGSLYKNLGGLKFEELKMDKTFFNLEAVGTGVSMVDINNDGLLDIYLCYMGPESLEPGQKSNRLLINHGNFTFTEGASKYGLDNKENSVQASFFDYDKDGDLDMYLVNTITRAGLSRLIVKEEFFDFDNPSIQRFQAQDRLFQNNGQGHFLDVTITSGLRPETFYGFNATIGDYNNDTWPDVFVTNDFNTPDLLYINNRDGTFTDLADQYLKHTSYFSMGADAGDIDNNGFDDIVVVDMTPEDYRRSRRNMSMTDSTFYNAMVNNGYGRQYMHNMLHMNTGRNVFREISQFAGIDKTDWSWAVLMDDFDNDGLRDLYVTNGIGREIMDKDAHGGINYWLTQNKNQGSYEEFKNLIGSIPSKPIENYLFSNQGKYRFENVTAGAQIAIPSFSQGAATVDLDNDGDLELVVNNFNHKAFLFENKSNSGNYLQLKLSGPPDNPFGIGTKVCVNTELDQQCNKLFVSRGYMSSTDYRLHFGLGHSEQIHSLEITWPDGKYQSITNPEINKMHTLSYEEATTDAPVQSNKPRLFTEVSDHEFNPHRENYYDDFADQILLPHKLSALGPALAQGDVNGDGLTDLFIGGGKDQASSIYTQKTSGSFIESKQPALVSDKHLEDTDAQFFDFDQDGDLDLFVTTGSYEYEENSVALTDRLYLNDSKGNFTYHNSWGSLTSNSMSMAAGDLEGDGDLDLFVGGRAVKGKYPLAPRSYLLINEEGKFINRTDEISNGLSSLGMVTDAEFVDIDGDEDLDLVVVGEWLPIIFFENENGRLTRKTLPFEEETRGWWNTIEVADINSDGKEDLVLGNLGLNYKFQASVKKPFELFGGDLDSNGTYEIVLAKQISDTLYPVRGKMCSSAQMPSLAEDFPSFNAFAEADLLDIYGDKLNQSIHLKATKFESCLLLNNGNWDLNLIDLPPEAQLSAVNDIVAEDINGDRKMDLVLAGNLYGAEIETTRGDAGIGLLLMGDGTGDFQPVDPLESGFFVDKDVKRMAYIEGYLKHIVVVNNNDIVQLFTLNESAYSGYGGISGKMK